VSALSESVALAERTLVAQSASIAAVATLLGLVAYACQRRGAAPVSGPEPCIGSRADELDLFLALLLGGLFWSFTQSAATAVQSEHSPLTLSQVLSSSLTSLSLVGLVALYLRTLRKRSLGQWFGLVEISERTVVSLGLRWGILGWLSTSLLGAALLPWLASRGFDLHRQEAIEMFARAGSASVRIALSLTAVIIAPMAEEFIFRGWLYPVLKRFTTGPFAALATALLFGAVHVNFAGLIPLTFFGLLLCWLYERSGSLLTPMLAHSLFNGITLLLIRLVPEVAVGP
jgi:uncharacterized protein